MPGQQSTPSRLAPLTLVAAGVASAVTTLVIARFGLAGTILGAALAPVLVALVGEGVRRPAERVRTRTTSVVARRPGDEARRSRFSLERVSWRRVGLIGGGAFLAVVLAFTFADLVRGDSPVSERGTTFFTTGRDGPSDSPLEDPSPDPGEPREETPPPPATDTQPPPTVTEPPTTTDPPPPTETTPG